MLTTRPELLCAVDFSRRSGLALTYAAALTDHFKARLRVLVALPEGNVATHGDRVQEWLGRFVVESLRGSGVRSSPEMIVRSGVAGEAILRAASEARTDLIVMATHGHGSPGGAYGSTAAHVLAHASVPVLVVPSRVQPPPGAQAELLLASAGIVLTPVDFHSRARHDARIAAGLAEAFGLPLVLLHVLRAGAQMNAADAQAALEAIAGDIRARGRLETLVSHGDPAREISRIAALRKAGAVVMGLRGEPRAAGSPPGSIAYAVLCRAPAVVVALPAAVRQVPAETALCSSSLYAQRWELPMRQKEQFPPPFRRRSP